MNQLARIEHGHALDAAAREQIASELRRALARIESDDVDVDAAEDAIAEASARLAAWSVTWTGGMRRATDCESSGDAVSVLRGADGEPVSEFLLLAFGEIELERATAGVDFHFTRAHAEQAAAWFRRVGRELAIDYEHQSIARLNGRADGLRPAAGWIGGLEVREDGLWAVDVRWTKRAAEMIRGGEYRYFSPVIFWSDEDYTRVEALGPVALTNDPAMRRVPALAASRGGADEPAEDESPADDPESARREIGLLRRRLAIQEAETFVERGMRQGKIVEATSADWRDDYLRDAEAAAMRLSRAPVILPPGRIVTRESLREPASSSGLQAAAWGVEPADIEAYERAATAGRVRGM